MDPPNPNPNLNPNPASRRVLIRPPPSSYSSPPSQTIPIPSSSSDPPSTDGVVVVGFIGPPSTDHSAQLINRILDSNVFGSGNRDKSLGVENQEELRDWLKWRRISYYHEEQKGILFLQSCSTLCSAVDDNGLSDSGSGFDSVFEEHDFGDLQGMLFMFSVCHVIIYILEGSRFDTQLLKKFRVLQAAKHALAPLVRPRNMQPTPSKPYSSSSRPTTSATSSKNSSPGRGGGMLTRNASAISLMSGLGSYTSLFPGQCTPVTLFVFIDDFSDVPNPSSSVEDSADTSPLNQPSSLGTSARPSLPIKGSGSVVVLARPVSKSEGSFRKKLQSSLEAQIRFLIKKCRTLSGSETGHSGSRNGGASNSAPLFSLDASRAVLLLDRYTNQRGESLEFATGLVEDVLNGKATSDSLLLESHGQNASKEDIISVKEFIYRQSDILRGRGGVVTNSNSGSAAGVGMAAVAAAVAAASAASAAASTTSGKTFNAPELPTLQIWLSSSQQILHGVLSAKGGCIDETEISKRKPRTRNTIPQPVEGVSLKGMDPLDLAVSWLESGNKMNSRFSTLWCERTLPAAKEVYLKDLPACYPTSQHEDHLEKALHAFHSMVKGHAVQHFAKKLEDECTSIWKSGRQLCDAVSLTGKPCMHQRHNVDSNESLSGATVKQHSSGYVFLHACSCGRSRRLRSDPFDFESANITFSCFPDCDKLLPTLQLPEVSSSGPIQSSSWSLIRIGGARYYDPYKGLLQSGFCSTQKFLMKWTISMAILNRAIDFTAKAMDQGSAVKSGTNFKLESKADVQLHSKELQSRVESHRKPAEDIVSDDNKISFGKGLPNFTMRKPFSEVVAGTAAADSGFPPIQLRKKSASSLDKSFKQIRSRDQSTEQNSDKGTQKSRDDLPVQETVSGISSTHVDPYLRIGSNVVPMNLNGVERSKPDPSFKHVTVYVGFEHECPHGHRFLLNPENLDELGSSYQLPEESQVKSDHIRADSSKLSRNGFHGKAHRNSSRITATGTNRERNVNKSKDIVTNGVLNSDGMIQFSGPGKEQNHTISVSTVANFSKHDEGSFQSINIDDGGCAFSMLNRNLPIYMNCPHCRLSKNKQDPPNTKFSGTVSQLQRIFMVTPPFPVILATCPVIQFEASCLPPSIPEREQQLRFSLGCQVVLPPESFLTLRLPFVYGVELEDGSLRSLNCFEHQPEATAWITKGTALQVISKRNSTGQD
ncbi:hypothetical protein RchiOBHm_Chr5g0056861 [Rosa chinensis]|uniref:Nonsense-mediated mRNA decay factor SMG8 n=1 Tax=Rosa chinensis TaxID=74649 RepID=A0A2P6QGS0_ROSCH|nr:uncharacterized protein LOC112164467 [Rosa chinensis]XP_024156430.1 uncharacterized protein LOC112164467 [Rosa chinensis]XP_024156431.1 uncharacterized protein LOC112164467 [Rosa chinensis]XP_024156432.1 uncharacterized protein LOC112164467 [Rosa chinensis]XP_024156433.1 uncharacterized protein LOC112164467 [Rosa chinensis]XP_024156435.1 uncharacterized protein LOC112164467 [Rosa chinensis]XP_024156436.1 uncharacterized protein LOC112164467 [Rosa chinensis]XP_040362013.1 uncharacterized p